MTSRYSAITADQSSTRRVFTRMRLARQRGQLATA
jgi:hypothetical protein